MGLLGRFPAIGYQSTGLVTSVDKQVELLSFHSRKAEKFKDFKKEQIKEMLENLPDHLNVMEGEIDSNVQKEYFNISKALKFDALTSKEVIAESQTLFLENAIIQSKKRVLILLAHSPTVRSYRIIERYLKNPDRELRNWALLALQECRTMLESVLLEESRGTISAGLGGSVNRLRYFLLISSTTEEPFTKNQIDLINEEFDLVCQKHDCRIEASDFGKNYATMKILIPLDVAVGHVIELGIDECNKMDHFLSSTYYVTNVKIPSQQELLELIKEIKE